MGTGAIHRVYSDHTSYTGTCVGVHVHTCMCSSMQFYDMYPCVNTTTTKTLNCPITTRPPSSHLYGYVPISSSPTPGNSNLCSVSMSFH